GSCRRRRRCLELSSVHHPGAGRRTDRPPGSSRASPSERLLVLTALPGQLVGLRHGPPTLHLGGVTLAGPTVAGHGTAATTVHATVLGPNLDQLGANHGMGLARGKDGPTAMTGG